MNYTSKFTNLNIQMLKEEEICFCFFNSVKEALDLFFVFVVCLFGLICEYIVLDCTMNLFAFKFFFTMWIFTLQKIITVSFCFHRSWPFFTFRPIMSTAVYVSWSLVLGHLNNLKCWLTPNLTIWEWSGLIKHTGENWNYSFPSSRYSVKCWQNATCFTEQFKTRQT